MVLPDFQRSIDAIAIDLDGTLLNSRSLLSERSSSAVKNCLARGLPIIIATARPERSVRRLLGPGIAGRCSLVLENGAIGIGVHPLSGRIKIALPSELARQIIALLLGMEPEIHVTVELEGEAFGTNFLRDPAGLWEMNAATPEMQLPLDAALAGEPTKIAAGGLHRDLSHVVDALRRRFGDSLSVVPSNGMTFINVTNRKAAKPDTLRSLLQSRQIALADVVALGDDIPDVGLMSACGMPIAMANAVPEVKAVTKYRTASNDEDGVAVVLERILAG